MLHCLQLFRKNFRREDSPEHPSPRVFTRKSMNFHCRLLVSYAPSTKTNLIRHHLSLQDGIHSLKGNKFRLLLFLLMSDYDEWLRTERKRNSKQFCRLKNSYYQKASTLEVPPHIPNKFISKSAGSTPLPSPPSLSRAPSSTEFPATSWPQEEIHYLPMNSFRKHIENFNTDQTLKQTAEEQHYVVMSSFITDQTWPKSNFNGNFPTAELKNIALPQEKLTEIKIRIKTNILYSVYYIFYNNV